MNQNKSLILEWIEHNQEEMIVFLQQLISIPSDNPSGDCEAIAGLVYDKLEQFDLSPVLHEVDEHQVRKVGMFKVANVVADVTIGSGHGPVIALNSHGDVVPPGLGWSVNPYGGDIIDGKIYGRGAAVSKSDIAAYTFAVRAIQACTKGKSGKLVLAFTFDEETGGEIGPLWLLENRIILPDAVICAGFTHSAVHAHNGCLHLEVKIRGKSAHAAIPDTGIDAIEGMTKVLAAVYTYRDSLANIGSEIKGIQSPTINVGLISGGINTNVVPDECVIRIDRRIIPEENAEDVEAGLVELIEKAVSEIPGIQLDIRRVLLARSYGPVPEDSTLVRTLSQNWNQIMGKELPIHGVPLYADARHFYEQGIPTIMFGAGPRTLEEANGHRADEHVRLDDLLQATKIVALTLYDLLEG